MSALFNVLGGVLGGFTSGLFNYQSQQSANQTNIQNNRETNELNERLTRESWVRDDNSVQRRVADLKAAGLNPVLAAGSAASNSSPIAVHSVGVDPASKGQAFASAFNSALDAIRSFMDYRIAKETINNIRANVNDTKAATQSRQINNNIARIQEKTARLEYNKLLKYGGRPQSVVGRHYYDARQYFDTVPPKVFNYLKNVYNSGVDRFVDFMRNN